MARSRELKVVLSGDTRSLDRAFAKAGKGAESMGGRAAKAAKVASLALGGGLAVALKKSVDAFAEAEKIGAQTNAVLKSTGQAANVTAKQVGDLATALSKKSGFDDEAIQSGQNLLLTFTRIRNETGKGNDIFNQTTRAMLDMSVALGQDTKSSAIQLGKALNDPVKGVTALQRVGVSFTKEQRKQINTLVESGKTMDAQKLILKELQVEFGGSAEAAGNTFAGKINKAKVAVGNLGEAIGGPLAGALGSAAQGMADFVSKLTTSERPARFFTSVGEQVANLKEAIGGVFDDFKTLREGPKLPSTHDVGITVQPKSFAASLGSAIGAGVASIDWGPIGDTMSAAFTKGADFTGKLAPAVATGISTALGQIDGRKLLSGLLRVVSEAFGALFSPKFWIDNFSAIFSTITIAIPVAKILKIPGADFLFRHISKPIFSAFRKLGGAIISRLGKIGGDGVTGFLAGLESIAPRTAGVLLGLVTGTGKWLSGMPGKFRAAGGRAVDKITDAIGGGVGAIAGGVGRLVGAGIKKLGSLVPGWVRAGARFAAELIKGIVKGLAGLPGKVGGALKGGLGKIAGAVGGFLGIGEGIGRSMRPKLAKGGGGSLMGASRALAPIAAVGSRFGLRVSSGRAGRQSKLTSTGNVSYHSSGEAIDLAGPPAGMLQTFKALKSTIGGRLAELIYTPGGVGIKNGRPHRYTGKVAADHHDHVHAALDLGRPGPGIGDGLGKGRIQNLWTQAGGSASVSNLAAAVALAESGGNPNAKNVNRDGSIDRGLWQINSVHGALSTFDPKANARSAVKISSGGRNWRPWVAYTTGAYKRFLSGGGGGGSSGPSRARIESQIERNQDRLDALREQLGNVPSGKAGAGRRKKLQGQIRSLVASNRNLRGDLRDAPTAAEAREARERAGSRLVNTIAQPFSKGFRKTSGRAARLGSLIEDADTTFGQTERAFGQTEEDLGTAEGRKQRLSELGELAKLKKKTLDRQKRRATALERAIRNRESLLRKLRKARDKAKGAKRAKINERIRPIVDKLDDLKAELKALGFAIRDTELDIGDLVKEAGEVAATPDTAVDTPEPQSPTDIVGGALASLDLQERAGVISAESARQQRISYLTRALAGEFGAPTREQGWEIMALLREAQQEQTQATDANTAALRDLQKELAQANAIATSQVGIQLAQAQRALGDLVSGELGGRVRARSTMPGSGSLSRL